jgi:hypothetical protein
MHPEQRWSAALGQTMLKAVRTLSPAVITAAYLERLPQHVQERPALPGHYASAVRVVLGRRANDQELEQFGLRKPLPTIKQVYEELILSDEFLEHRGRAIASF